ncbi:MAG TPA: ATP-dependent DNA ligase [Casimicrobiaceae bacterium]|nr:ATP-dependent DNA ligase [Casimicrobiaceae bacterium]
MTTLAALVAVSERVGRHASRRSKIAELAAFLRALGPEEIALGVAYLAGETRQGRGGIGYALIRAAAAPPAATSALTLAHVDSALQAVVETTGRGSVAARTQALSALFARATAEEQAFVVRLLLGELRQGALEGLMVEAVAAAAALPAGEVRRAASIAGGIAAVARAALLDGAAGLRGFRITLFQPLAPMLAQPADDMTAALGALRLAAVEWKLDGARVQVHKQAGEVRIFTRTGNDVTPAAPEIVAAVHELPAGDLILDGEAIALREDGAPYPFQDTMRRFGRQLDVEAQRAALPLSVFFFDCLRHDGVDLVGEPASTRFARLADALPAHRLTPRLVTGDPVAAQAFYDDAIARGHEGVMVKALDAPYEPGTRSAAWLKVKRTHTLDLVVLAAEWGHGRRHRWLSNLHLGARDPASGGFVMLGKTFKGLTDALLEWQTQALLERAVTQDDWVVHVRPELVVEIAFNDLQASPRYPGGLALRFARVKGYRPDKQAADADTIETVRAIYAAQSAPAERG